MILHRLLSALAQRAPKLAPKEDKPEAPQGLPENITDPIAQFLALPMTEQMSLIEAELERLPDNEKRLIVDILKHELKRKWIPQPRQVAALTSKADILLYGGSAGGGKTDLLLGLALTEHKRSLIMRRQYTDLSFITDRALEIHGTRAGFNASPPPSLKTDDGRLIEFGAAQHAGDEQRWQGRPHDLLGIDEATQWLESQVRYLMGWVRSTDPKQRTRVVLATNPPLSDEGQWVVKMFRPWLDPGHPHPAKPGELRWFVTDEAGDDLEVDGPGPHKIMGKDVRALSRTFIPAKLADNFYLSRTDDYASKLDALHEPLRSAVRDGNFMAVRGDDAWQVIPSRWVREAQARWTSDRPDRSMTCIAVDIAQGGSDETVLSTRHGNWFAPLVTRKGSETPDGLSVASLVFLSMKDACQVVIDLGGGWGGDTYTHLTNQKLRVEGFRGADGSSGKSVGSNLEFANKRAETWWRFREALDPNSQERIALPPDQDLLADLCTPRLDPNAMQKRGIIQIESKEEIRKRLGRSPDKGDAVTMCWAYGGLLELERKEALVRRSSANVGHAASKRWARR